MITPGGPPFVSTLGQCLRILDRAGDLATIIIILFALWFGSHHLGKNHLLDKILLRF